jgi:tetratricopeptide (TPR) repeat protein
MGYVAHHKADYEVAKRLSGYSLALYQNLGDQREVGDVLLGLCRVARNTGAYDEAKQLAAQSLVLFETLGDHKGASDALLHLGKIAMYSGAYDEAKHLFAQHLQLSRAQSNLWGIVDSLGALGNLARFQGEFKASTYFLQQAVAISWKIGDWEGLARVVIARLASAYCFCGNFALASSVAEKGVAIGQNHGVPSVSLFYTNMSLAEAHVHIGRYKAVRTWAEKVPSLAHKVGRKTLTIWAQKWLGWVALAEERYAEAYHFFQESVANFLTATEVEYRSWALVGLGRAAYGLGDRSEAQQDLVQALRMVAEIQAFIPLLFLLPIISLLLADETDISRKERAVEVYALCSTHPFVANSSLLADIAGRHVAAVAATLPPEVVEAAQSRGRKLEWWATAADLLDELETANVAER